MNIKRFSITLTIIAALIVGYLVLSLQQTTLEKDLKAQYLKAGDFQLNHGENLFQLSNLKGHPAILYFGYTHCPDVCPVGLAVIRDALNSDSDFKDVKALFVTLDPLRDTAEKMREYAAFFHPNIIALTGNLEQIKSVAGAYGTFFRRADIKPAASAGNESGAEEPFYTVDHSSYFYLIDSKGSLVRVLDHDTKSTDLAKILAQLL